MSICNRWITYKEDNNNIANPIKTSLLEPHKLQSDRYKTFLKCLKIKEMKT